MARENMIEFMIFWWDSTHTKLECNEKLNECWEIRGIQIP